MNPFRSWKSYERFAQQVKWENRYIQTGEVKQFLDTLLETSKDKQDILKTGTVLYRSQRGYDEIEEYAEDGTTVIGFIPLPYKQNRMIPNAEKTTNGRANPEGIPYLYLSDDMDTALSEVRPWLDEKLSLAVFTIKRDLRLIDFSRVASSSTYYFKEPEDSRIRENEVWASINRAFSKPVTIEDQAKEYVPTQIISEFFKVSGIDAIKYKSMLSDGNNYVLFNVADAVPIMGSVIEVRGLKYQFEQYGNPTKYSTDGSNARIYNTIVKFMPLKKKKRK